MLQFISNFSLEAIIRRVLSKTCCNCDPISKSVFIAELDITMFHVVTFLAFYNSLPEVNTTPVDQRDVHEEEFYRFQEANERATKKAAELKGPITVQNANTQKRAAYRYVYFMTFVMISISQNCFLWNSDHKVETFSSVFKKRVSYYMDMMSLG